MEDTMKTFLRLVCLCLLMEVTCVTGMWAQFKVHCHPVGGMLMTNFGAVDANTTLGYATGDLKGSVAATVLNVAPGPGGTVVFTVQHHWVTESGDNIFTDQARAVTQPLSQTLFAVISYPVHVTGGTGKFAGVTGDLQSIGEADLSAGTVFRYTGKLCSKE
jgi:hypothetical protein